MAERRVEKLDGTALNPYSTEQRWYYKTLEGRISPEARKLLEEYSHIPEDEVDNHIYKMRETLWSKAPYPCIGKFDFLSIRLLKHPFYQTLLTILKSSPDKQLLDLGCCVGQELRSLAFNGIPSTNLYGSDLIPAYITTSYELFNDKDTFKGTLVPADAFSDTIWEKEWSGWEGKFDVVHAGLFLHLFTWERQLIMCQTIIKLLKSKEGDGKNDRVIFLGEMVGQRGGGEKGTGFKGPSGEEHKVYLHDPDSMKRLWDEAAQKTGTVGQWKVEGKLKARSEATEASESFFQGEGVGWFMFTIERV
ncbi:hypothetical protein F5884DRAFT_747875 [Xylogone sp. PMI_703]|nr:hypothetical protein F5884DRAFT_747875 [Xylogone sp. PMI_703]